MDKNLILKAQFEELLLKSWTSFIDFKRLTALVMKFVRDSEFPVIKTNELKVKGTQVKLSRFEPISDGFTVWVEFSIPRDEGVAVGTTELHLTNLGDAEHVQTLGNVFVRDQKKAI